MSLIHRPTPFGLVPRALAAAVIAAVIAAASAGCTQVTVKRVDPAADSSGLPGIRYSLPKPCLQVTPAPDGTVTVDVVMLPDPLNTYRIDGWSFASTHTLNVKLANGLLTGVTVGLDSAGVGAELVKASGEVTKGELERRAKERAAEQTAQQVADDAVAAAELAVDKARVAYEVFYASNPTSDETTKALAALRQAEAELAAARRRRDALRGSGGPGAPSATSSSADAVDTTSGVGGTVPAATTTANANDAAGTGGTGGTGGGAGADAAKDRPATGVYAPILYTIDERGAGDAARVILRPALTGADPQPLHETVSLSKPPAPLTFFPRGSFGVVPGQHGALEVLLTASGPIKRVVYGKTTFTRAGQNERLPLPEISQVADTAVRVDLRGKAPGTYNLNLAYESAGSNPNKPPVVTFEFVIK